MRNKKVIVLTMRMLRSYHFSTAPVRELFPPSFPISESALPIWATIPFFTVLK